LAIEVDRAIDVDETVAVLERLAAERGLPRTSGPTTAPS